MGLVSALPTSVTLTAAHNTQGHTRMQPAKQLRADGCCRGATLDELLLHCYTAYLAHPIHRRSKQGTTHRAAAGPAGPLFGTAGSPYEAAQSLSVSMTGLISHTLGCPCQSVSQAPHVSRVQFF